MRLAPTFERRCYDAKIKLVGACIKVWEWATVADFGCCQAEFMQSFTVSYTCSVELLGGVVSMNNSSKMAYSTKR